MRLGGQVEFEARIGSVPELVNEMCGHKLVRFVIAVTEKYINNNVYSQHTHWYTVNALGDTADTILKSNMRICDTICISGNWLIDELSNNYEILARSISEVSKIMEKKFNVA